MNLRIANTDEFEKVRDFYYKLIDMMQGSAYFPMWEKGIYPTDSYLQESVQNGELWICETNGECIGAMVVNHENNEGYKNIRWTVDTDAVSVIHILGVLPTHQGKGVAGRMVQKAIEIAASTKQKALRLDVLDGNLPAEKLYTKHGFKYIDTVRMFYEDTGWTDFRLFEFAVEE